MMANIFRAAPATLIDEEDESIRRGPWTVEEDMTLIRCISARGEGRWNTIAKYAGLRRTGKSCRLRWLNYLRPDVKRGNITPEEQFLILDLHQRWGNRWSKIARHLPGRTDNEIKNFWRTRVKKLIQKAKCSGDMRLQLQDYSHSHYNSCSWISKSSSIDTSNSNQCPMSSKENRSFGANGLDIQVDGRESVGFTPTGVQRFASFHSDQGLFCSTNYPRQKDVAALSSFGCEQNQWTSQGEACGLGCGCSYERYPPPLGDILDNHETPLCSTGVRSLPINDVNVVFNPVITSQSEFIKGSSASGLGSGLAGSIDSSEVEASSSNDGGIFDVEIGWPYETNSLWNNEEMWYAPEA